MDALLDEREGEEGQLVRVSQCAAATPNIQAQNTCEVSIFHCRGHVVRPVPSPVSKVANHLKL